MLHKYRQVSRLVLQLVSLMLLVFILNPAQGAPTLLDSGDANNAANVLLSDLVLQETDEKTEVEDLMNLGARCKLSSSDR